MVLGLHPWVAAWPRAPEALADGRSPLGLGARGAGSRLRAGGDGCKRLLAPAGLEVSGVVCFHPWEAGAGGSTWVFALIPGP